MGVVTTFLQELMGVVRAFCGHGWAWSQCLGVVTACTGVGEFRVNAIIQGICARK